MQGHMSNSLLGVDALKEPPYDVTNRPATDFPILSGYPNFSQKSRRHPDFPDLIPHIPIFGVRNCQRQGRGMLRRRR